MTMRLALFYVLWTCGHPAVAAAFAKWIFGVSYLQCASQEHGLLWGRIRFALIMNGMTSSIFITSHTFSNLIFKYWDNVYSKEQLAE